MLDAILDAGRVAGCWMLDAALDTAVVDAAILNAAALGAGPVSGA